MSVLTALDYSFRLNPCNDVIEVNGEPISDIQRATIRTQMRDLGYKRYLTAIEEHGPYNIPTLATYFKDVDGVFSTWLVRWMVGAVVKALDGEQNVMLMLDGPQDIGKSCFVRWLGSGLPGYHVEAPINTEDKDAWLRLISKWIWELAEL